MADNDEQCRAEKIEAAGHTSKFDMGREITRVTLPDGTEIRSRYTPRVDIQTVAAEMIDRWPGSGNAGGQQGDHAPVATSEKPRPQQSKDR